MKPVSREEARKLAETGAIVAAARDRAVLVVKGADRVSWLNGLLTQDVSRAKPGDGAFSFLCEKKGKIVCDLHAFFEGDHVDLVVPAASRSAVLAALDHHLIMEDVELGESSRPVFRVYGPRSAEVVAAFGGRVWDVSGLGGGLFLGAEEGAEDVFGDTLAEALRAVDGAVANSDVEEWLRVSLGVPRFGVDYDGASYPQETALHTLGVSFSKGCYLGQEVLYMLENRGHAKTRLVRLVCDRPGVTVPAVAAVVETPDGASVGAITSVAQSSSAGAWTAIAMLKRAAVTPGTELVVAGGTCKVHAIPAAVPEST